MSNSQRPYRARRKDNNKMIYGWYSYNSRRDIHMITEDNSGTNVVHPSTVSQSTGKHDKNGDEIFDKCQIKSGRRVLNVFWDENAMRFMASEKSARDTPLCVWALKQFEIIPEEKQ